MVQRVISWHMSLRVFSRYSTVYTVREQEIADEFSHTVMHGVKLQKALMPANSPSPSAARPLPPKPIAGRCTRFSKIPKNFLIFS